MSKIDADNLKSYLKAYVESVTTKSKYGLYICPLCHSGTGKRKTGAFSVKDNHWECFACDSKGDIFDLYGLINNESSFRRQAEAIANHFGVELEERKPQSSSTAREPIKPAPEPQQEPVEEEAKPDYTNFYQEASSHIEDTSFWLDRGLSLDTVKKANLGYVECWQPPPPPDKANIIFNGSTVFGSRLIIPTSKSSYVARATNPKIENRYYKVGSSSLYLAHNILDATKPIFIVEGELDALSIIEAGGIAVGLGSTANTNKLEQYLTKHRPQYPLLLALDNDEAGQKATEKLAEKLLKLGVLFYRTDLYSPLLVKDANEALLKDREAFINLIKEAENQQSEEEKAEREAYLKNSVASHFDSFVQSIEESKNRQAIATGFSALDYLLDGGLFDGLYIIGAISSLGKTTFILQIADQIARQASLKDESLTEVPDVLIFSLEMSRYELMSKSISRHTCKLCRESKASINDAKTARAILAGNYGAYTDREQRLISRSYDEYKQYSSNVYIVEGDGTITASVIRDAVARHIHITGRKPVVIIDYLQILTPAEADKYSDERQKTDSNVIALKHIARDYSIPVIAISSFNRESYMLPVSMSSFKESGAIEYSADVLLGLQLTGVAEEWGSTVKSKKQSIAKLNTAKAKEPRDIQLAILKNRNGVTGRVVNYSFWAKYNYFEECGIEPLGL